MAQSVCTHTYEIVALDKVKNSRHERNRILDEGGMYLVRCICDCVRKVLRGNIPVTDEEKERLRKYKDCLRELAEKKTSDKKREHLIQEGGFLGALISILVSLVGKLHTGQKRTEDEDDMDENEYYEPTKKRKKKN